MKELANTSSDLWEFKTFVHTRGRDWWDVSHIRVLQNRLKEKIEHEKKHPEPREKYIKSIQGQVDAYERRLDYLFQEEQNGVKHIYKKKQKETIQPRKYKRGKTI